MNSNPIHPPEDCPPEKIVLSSEPAPDFGDITCSVDPDLYVDRDFSWLHFNNRVMEEALDEKNPLLERVRFLSIFASNLDEYFMVRIPSVHKSVLEESMSFGEGHRYSEMQKIYTELPMKLKRMEHCWSDILVPELAKENIRVLEFSELEDYQIEYANQYFKKKIFPLLTPLAYDSSHPFPYITNQSVNLVIIISDVTYGHVFVRLKIPSTVNRLVQVPSKEDVKSGKTESNMEAGKSGKFNFVWLDDLIIQNLKMVFPGQDILEAHAFRITRDGDLGLDEDGDYNLMKSIEKKSGSKYFGMPLRLEINEGMSDFVLKILLENFKLPLTQVESLKSPVGLSSISEICDINRPDLKYPPFTPKMKEQLKTSKRESIFSKIKSRDVLVYRPYNSFDSMIDFVQAASVDANVVAIKITLYRVDKKSKIIQYLKEAADNGKQVVALIELKARFDEENNVAKAKELEHANIHVIYGVPNMKTHAKICLVLRQEKNDIVPYIHMSTGNYNAATAKIYTDFEYFTADPDIGQDAVDLFNALTGYSRKMNYNKLLVAPHLMRGALIGKIRREVENHKMYGNGYILFKLNSLVDPECITELYKASIAGVRIDLQIRGISCIRPQLPGYSDNIRVTSIVGRFLEHTRAYYFYNNGSEEMYLGSADLMQRNLDRRIEILFPVNEYYLRKIKDNILAKHLEDNVKLRTGLPDGSFVRVDRPDGAEPLDSQLWMTKNQNEWE